MELDLEQMTDEELYALIEDAQTELGKRQTAELAEQEIADVVKKHRASGIIDTPEQGDEWRQPTGGNYYTLGDIVYWDDKRWESTVAVNVRAPNVSGWRQLPEEDPDTGELIIPEYQQPTGAHDAYQTGERVTWQGQVYESVIDGNVWSPTDHAAGWQLIEPDNGDDEANDDPDALPEWAAGVDYETGQAIMYEGTPYRVLQDHISFEHLTPDTVPALYEPGTIVEDDVPEEPTEPEPTPEPEPEEPVDDDPVDDEEPATEPEEPVEEDPVEEEPADEIPDFVPPTGGHDVYQLGDRVRFGGQIWESVIANNSWSPTDYPAGWKVVEG